MIARLRAMFRRWDCFHMFHPIGQPFTHLHVGHGGAVWSEIPGNVYRCGKCGSTKQDWPDMGSHSQKFTLANALFWSDAPRDDT